MKLLQNRLKWLALTAYIVLPGVSYAAPGTLSDTPLWLGASVKHNLMLMIDDSGSMDFEVLFDNNDGALYLDGNGFFADNTGKLYSSGKKYVYLFPNGYSGSYNGKRRVNNHYAVPPIKAYAFARSPNFNSAYYDPNTTYDRWPKIDGYPHDTFEDAEITATKFEPVSKFASDTINLFATHNTADYSEAQWNFDIEDGDMICKNDGSKCSTGDRNYSYYPAVYYLKDTQSSYKYGGQVYNCSTPTPAHYRQFAEVPNNFENVDAIAPDGSCLKKYKITGSDSGATFVNGATESRTLLEEKQNFANWFQYYRRRHQAMRGGLASALQGIQGIHTGLDWINKRRQVSMYDMNKSSDVNAMLKEHFEYVSSGGTPLRRALEHSAAQYRRTDTGAPVYDMCQKNFTLLFTDGYNSGTSASVNNADESAGEPYADGYSNTLGDIAFHHYKTPLRTGAGFPAEQVTVPAECKEAEHDKWLDCNANLHMNTYIVGLGAKGTIFNNTVGGVTYNKVSDAYANPPTWPNVNSSRDARQIDDLYHAAVNGRGEMYSADSPAELKDALGSALQSIAAILGSGSSVTFNSSSLRANDGSAIFTTSFNSGDWSGNVNAKILDGSSGAVKGDAWADSEGVTGAAALLDELESDARVIFTLGENQSGDADGVVFQYNNLTAAQKLDLKTNADGTVGNDENGESRLNYIRGFLDAASIQVPDGSGGTRSELLRNRTSRLGDVIHSTPVYVGKPSSSWPNRGYFGAEGKRYTNFVSSSASERQPILYVGANDGMLHGFNASLSGTDAGQEAFAYVPGAVYSSEAKAGLHYLSDPNYEHRYYVDLTPVAQDVFIVTDKDDLGVSDTDSDRDAKRNWTTVLVGGMRTGGRGIFALDVTDPSDYTNSAINAEDTVLWEFTDAHSDDMGYLDEGVSIAMLNDQKWAVIFGNGYNSENGEAGVFIVYIEEGIDGAWTVNDDYRFLGTGVGSSGDKNGLSTVAVADLDGDRVADRIYGGDLKGNMWAFDISSDDPSDWGSAYKNGSAPEALFVATDADGNPQPITAAPGLATNSEQSDAGNEPNVFVTFGTGQYLVAGDQIDDSVQSYYTIWDNGDSAGGAIERADLATRALSQTGDVLKMAGDAIDWTAQQGWYFDFVVGSAENGERLVNKPLLRADKDVGPVAIFASMIPGDSACEGGGTSTLYALPVANGLNPVKAIMDLDGDGIEAVNDEGESDDLGVGTKRESLLNDPNCLESTCYSSLDNYTKLGGEEKLDQTDINIESGSERVGRLGWYEM